VSSKKACALFDGLIKYSQTLYVQLVLAKKAVLLSPIMCSSNANPLQAMPESIGPVCWFNHDIHTHFVLIN
jgi:hypothetical protein